MKNNGLIKKHQNYHLVLYVIESLLQLIRCKILIHCFSPQYWKKSCGHFQSETLYTHFEKYEAALAISRAVKWMSKRLPWNSLCLDQALAVQAMLKRRRIAHTLYLGMTRNNDGKWVAHAWVRAGSLWIIGYSKHMDYTVVGSYAVCNFNPGLGLNLNH